VPDAGCTGYLHTGVTLHTCALRITAPGVYDSCRFAGTLVIASDGITVRRSLVAGGHIEGATGSDLRSVRLEDVEIAGPGNDQMAAIGNNNYTCLRCDVHGGLRGFALGSDVTIVDSYAHHLYVETAAERAGNLIHQTAASTHGSSNITITHSNLWCKSDAYACSNGVSFYAEDSDITNVIIRNCWIHTDAGYSIGFFDRDHGKDHWILSARILDNILGPSEFGNGAPANWPSASAGNVWSGNVRPDGSPVLP
jgi:hypothetical protein